MNITNYIKMIAESINEKEGNDSKLRGYNLVVHPEKGDPFHDFYKTEYFSISPINLIGQIIEDKTGYEFYTNTLENDRTFMLVKSRKDDRIYVECCDLPDSDFWKKLVTALEPYGGMDDTETQPRRVDTEYSDKIGKDIYGFPLMIQV